MLINFRGFMSTRPGAPSFQLGRAGRMLDGFSLMEKGRKTDDVLYNRRPWVGGMPRRRKSGPWLRQFPLRPHSGEAAKCRQMTAQAWAR